MPITADVDRSNSTDYRSVDCVVVNWNGGDLIRECVASVQEFGARVSNLILVDNGSSDGSLSSIPKIDILRTIKLGQNFGFAKACNVGAFSGSSKYILFLNPDARLVDSSLDRVIRFMDSRDAEKIGICGIQLFDEGGSIQESAFNFTDASTYIGHALGLDGRLTKVFRPTKPDMDYEQCQFIDQPIGAFFLIRRSLFEELGGFDEQFFVYFEEVDLALRARHLGWRAYYLADATAYHKGGGISERVKPRRLFYTLRSRILYSHKHFSRVGFVLTAASTLCLEPLTRLMRALLRRSMSEALDSVRAYALLYEDLPNIVHSLISEKRKSLKSNSTDKCIDDRS